MTRPARTTIRRPGSGVTIDRERLVRMREVKLLSRAQLAAKMSGGPCPLCGQMYSHEADCANADEFSITPDAIAKIENGYRRPKTSTLSRLCEALGCEPEDLLPVDGALAPKEAAPRTGPRVPCPHCDALYGHESGCPDAT